MNNSEYLNEKNITYTVKEGDTLYSIAKKFNTSISDLITQNHLDNNLLVPNQILTIPKNSTPIIEHIGSDICDMEIKDKDPIYDTYIVKKNDNLYTIAKKFNTTVAKLIYINNLKNNLLSLNQKIKVPHHSANTINYIVKKQDNLYQIASNYNVTPKQIMDLNNLTSTSLTVGQTLKIPTFSTSDRNSYEIYIVKKEDSLYSISKKFNTTVAIIKKENHLVNNLLTIGQSLIIPK